MSLIASDVDVSIWCQFEVKNWDSSAADQSQNKFKFFFFHLGSLTQPQGYCVMRASSLLAEADLTAYRNVAFWKSFVIFWCLKIESTSFFDLWYHCCLLLKRLSLWSSALHVKVVYTLNQWYKWALPKRFVLKHSSKNQWRIPLTI